MKKAFLDFLVLLVVALAVGLVLFLYKTGENVQMLITDRSLYFVGGSLFATIALRSIIQLRQKGKEQQAQAQGLRGIAEAINKVAEKDLTLAEYLEGEVIPHLEGRTKRGSLDANTLIQVTEQALRLEAASNRGLELKIQRARDERQWQRELDLQKQEEARRLKLVPQRDFTSLRGVRPQIGVGVFHALADKIQRAYRAGGLKVQVIGGSEAFRSLLFDLNCQRGVKIEKLQGFDKTLAHELGANTCRSYSHNGTFRIAIPHPDPQDVYLENLTRQVGTLPLLTSILGIDEDGEVVNLCLSDPEVVHLLVSGTTGSGKTELAKTIIASLARNGSSKALKLLLIDPQSQGFGQFSSLPHLLYPIVANSLEAKERLQELVGEMEERYEAGRTSPAIVAVIDELVDLMLVDGKETEVALTRLTQRGRKAGIHLIACTQKPAASVIGGLVKSNFPTRLVGRVTSPEDARCGAGIGGTGAERLQGSGDFLLVKGGTITPFQTALSGM